MIGIRVAFILAVSLSTASPQTPGALQTDRPAPPTPPTVKNLDPSAIDKSTNPCIDFYQYACGNWIKNNPIPDDQVLWVRSLSQLQQRNMYELWQVLDRAADKPKSPLETKYGDFYAACMNVAELDKRGLKTLAPALDRIAGLKDSEGIAALIGDLAASGDPAPPFRLDIEPDQADSSKYIWRLSPSGLTLPDRESYIGLSARFVRKRFVSHVIRVFMLAGDTIDEAETEAAAVQRIEAAMAAASMSRADSIDPEKRYHIFDFAELQKLAPDFNFITYFEQMRTNPAERLNVADPHYVEIVNGLLTSIPVDSWKSYFRWHVLGEQAEALPKELRDENFTFWGSNLLRQEKPAPRWKQCTAITAQAFGDAMAQDWVKRKFPPAAKSRAEELATALEKALADEIRRLPWMSDATKKAAERKLAAIRNRIGYPERWRDYSGLRVDRNDFLGNLHRSTVFERNYVLSKAGKSVDADEWELNPTTTEVRYALDRNSLLLPAGVLQPPLFDPTADPALNFGSLGVLAAHELTHGFDTMGSKFDENGSMREWQAPEDRQRFAETASCYVAEYSQFRAMPGPDELPRLKVNGNLTLTENTADNGGLQIAFRALMDALAAEKRTVDEKIDGYTETQRFFLAFAQLSCQNQTLYSARRSLSTDAQSQGRARVNGAVQNLDEFGKAFQCVKGQPMYSSKPCRVW